MGPSWLSKLAASPLRSTRKARPAAVELLVAARGVGVAPRSRLAHPPPWRWRGDVGGPRRVPQALRLAGPLPEIDHPVPGAGQPRPDPGSSGERQGGVGEQAAEHAPGLAPLDVVPADQPLGGVKGVVADVLRRGPELGELLVLALRIDQSVARIELDGGHAKAREPDQGVDDGAPEEVLPKARVEGPRRS